MEILSYKHEVKYLDYSNRFINIEKLSGIMKLYKWLKRLKSKISRILNEELVDETNPKKNKQLSYWERVALRNEKIEQKRLEEKKRITDLKNSFKKCYICDNPINSATMFFCKYCDKGFCEIHRLPEDHKCKNPKLPYDMRKGYGVKHPTSPPNSGYTRESNYY